MKDDQTKNDYFRRSNSETGPVFYEIMVQGKLDSQRSKWFEGMTLAYIENSESGFGYTMIVGPVIDQPALHGLLTKIRDLNLILISVQRCIPGCCTMPRQALRNL
jgi:hypothetical protein